MIYSSSRRTDLPAFYPDFIADKIRRSRKLDGIVFWTKDPRHFLTHAELNAALRRVSSIIQLTITGLAGTRWEPRVPPPESFAETLRTLADILPPGAVRWRFDPIIATPDLFSRLQKIHSLLRDNGLAVEAVTVSFPTPYGKVRRHLADAGLTFPPLDFAEQAEILARIHSETALPVALCCQDTALLTVDGTTSANCIDHRLFNRLYGTNFSGEKDGGQRENCGCHRSTDIGAYQQKCAHQCVYCYAGE